jgi:anti-sigma factor RsiW
MAFGRNPVVCQQMVELVTDYLDGAMGRRARRRFEVHLANCEHCTEYVAQLRATIRLTGTITDDDFPPEMRADFLELYERWREEPV